MKILLLFINLVLTLYAIRYTLYADKVVAAPLSFSVSPPLMEIVTSSPAEIKKPIQLTNQGEEAVSLEIKFLPFTPKKESGEVEFLNIELPLKNLVSVLDEKTLTPQSEITLRAKEVKNLILYLSLPKDQEPTDHYFSVIFLSKSPTNKEPKKQNEKIEVYSEISGGIATNVLLSIRESSFPPTLKILEFTSPKFLQNGPVAFGVRLKNESQHFLASKGKILITNIFGQKIGQVDLPAENILSRSTRAYPLIVFPEKFLLGPYLAELKIDPAFGGATAKTTFFAFPVKQFLVGVLAIVIILIAKKRVEMRLRR